MGRCRRHPHHSVVGVCAHCLNDRLLALMDEEDDDEAMAHELYDMSPHAFYTYMPPPSCLAQAGSFSKQGAATPIALGARRASTEYNHAHVKQMAASYLNKHHRSLSSSPQLHPSNTLSYIKPSTQRRPRPSLNAHPPPFFAEEVTRKKRPSLWSLLLRPKDDSIASKRHAYDGNHMHSQGNEYTGVVKVRRIGARVHEEGIAGATKHTSKSSWNMDGYVTDGYGRGRGKPPSLSSSKREGFESCLSRNDGSSLLSSPKFMASPSRQASHGLFPSPVSKYTSPSPLKNEVRYRDIDIRASPARQVPVSYGLSGHVENIGMSTECGRDNDTSRSSWISSLFPRRHRRSKSISGSDAMSFSQASYLHSVGASPDSAGPKGRRKSVSFLDDLHESPSRYITAKLSQSNGIGIGFKTPDVQHRHAYGDTRITGSTEVKASNDVFKSSKASVRGALCEHLAGQVHSHSRSCSRGQSVNVDLAGSLSSPTISKANSTNSKSPRVKLANFLNKRKNGTVSIDCGRDVRVSPVPMLRVKRDYCNHNDLLDNSDYDQGLDGPHLQYEHRNDSFGHRYAEHLVMDSRFKEELQKSSMSAVKESPKSSPTSMATSTKDTVKSPRLMSLQAMKQLLKSPRLAPVRTTKRKPEDVDEGQPYAQFSRSWSKAFSKTLSPMLGQRKLKKKPSNIRKQEFVHDVGYAHSLHGYNDRHQNDEAVANRGRRLNVQEYSTYPYGKESPSARKQYLQHQHGRIGSKRGEELLVRETRVLPARDEKGPPQQYSFLSKDYSAFSFYFSPRRSESIDSATRSSKKGSVW